MTRLDLIGLLGLALLLTVWLVERRQQRHANARTVRAQLLADVLDVRRQREAKAARLRGGW